MSLSCRCNGRPVVLRPIRATPSSVLYSAVNVIGCKSEFDTVWYVVQVWMSVDTTCRYMQCWYTGQVWVLIHRTGVFVDTLDRYECWYIVQVCLLIHWTGMIVQCRCGPVLGMLMIETASMLDSRTAQFWCSTSETWRSQCWPWTRTPGQGHRSYLYSICQQWQPAQSGIIGTCLCLWWTLSMYW